MQKLTSFIISLIVSFSFAFPVSAMESKMMHGPGMPWFDDLPEFFDIFGGHHHGSFKIADLDLDDEPEIIILEDETLSVLDNKGNVLFTKTVEGIVDNHHHMMRNSKKDSFKTLHMGEELGFGFNHHNGGVNFEVANLDDDQNPEIIILDAEKLIVLDHNGDQEFTITLPEID
jgi:hypothetical protein